MTARAEFVEDLVRRIPSLKPVYERHMSENDELLAHIFFGDLTRFVISEHRETLRSGTSRPALDSVLEALEAGLAEGDPDVGEVIVVSFLENLWQAGDDYETLVKRLGPQLRLALETVERER
jgi:hypothetical protein